MTDFFTLNPRYERYELGVYPLEYQTVYGAERSPLGATLLKGLFLVGMMTALLKWASIQSLRFPINPTLADGIILIIAGATALLACTTEIINFFHSLRMNKRYEQLVKTGVILNGTIANIRIKEQRFSYRDKDFQMKEYRGTYYIVVTYTFKTPDQRMISGEQIRIREDLRDRPLPPIGTPIRVLYADDHTHVML